MHHPPCASATKLRWLEETQNHLSMKKVTVSIHIFCLLACCINFLSATSSAMDDNKHWGWKNRHGSLCICAVLDFVAICDLLCKDDDAIETFFLALEDSCFSPAACFVKVLCACFHKL
jgi:hypothetical protein